MQLARSCLPLSRWSLPLALTICALVGGEAAAQCNAGAKYCTSSTCCNAPYTVCVPYQGDYKCCSPEYPVGCSDGKHCGKTQQQCDCYTEGKEPCGDGCMPSGSVCCPGDGGTYCGSGQECGCGGCMPRGSKCCGNGRTCPSEKDCGAGACSGTCVEPGAVCCSDGKFCPAGAACDCGGCIQEGGTCCGAGYCAGSSACCADLSCIPSGATCCSSGNYCQSGSCGPTGTTCQATVVTKTSTASCPTGYAVCAVTTRCCPTGSSCLADGGCGNLSPPRPPTGSPSPTVARADGGRTGFASDAGMPPPPPQWGCSAGPGAAALWLFALVAPLLRRRRAPRGSR